MGKTTLAKLATDRPVIGSDAYREMDWADIPAAMVRDVQALPAFVVEGVQVARALRGPRGNCIRLQGMTVDAVVYLRAPKVPLGELLPGQVTMAKGVATVFEEWRQANSHVAIFEETGR